MNMTRRKTEFVKPDASKPLAKRANYLKVTEEMQLVTIDKVEKVVNADNSDLRFLEPKGVIVGLKFKGSIIDRNKGIKSGFVIYNNNKGVK